MRMLEEIAKVYRKIHLRIRFSDRFTDRTEHFHRYLFSLRLQDRGEECNYSVERKCTGRVL